MSFERFSPRRRNIRRRRRTPSSSRPARGRLLARKRRDRTRRTWIDAAGSTECTSDRPTAPPPPLPIAPPSFRRGHDEHRTKRPRVRDAFVAATSSSGRHHPRDEAVALCSFRLRRRMNAPHAARAVADRSSRGSDWTTGGSTAYGAANRATCPSFHWPRSRPFAFAWDATRVAIAATPRTRPEPPGSTSVLVPPPPPPFACGPTFANPPLPNRR